MIPQLKTFHAHQMGLSVVLIPFSSDRKSRLVDLRDDYNSLMLWTDQPDLQHIIVDFSELPSLDLTTISPLIRLSEKIERRGGQFVACELDEQKHDAILKLLALERAADEINWGIVPRRADAFKFVGRSMGFKLPQISPAP